MLVSALYAQTHSLKEVGKKLGISRERVRQLMKRADKAGICTYKSYDENCFDAALSSTTRDALVGEIKGGTSRDAIAQKYKIRSHHIGKLILHYGIDVKACIQQGRSERCVKEYFEFFEILKHHPNATELFKLPKGRALGGRIQRYWGSLEKFRKEHGIKPPEKWCYASIEKLIAKKNEAVEKAYSMIVLAQAVTTKEISHKLGVSSGTANRYLRELLAASRIKRVGDSTQLRYVVNKL